MGREDRQRERERKREQKPLGEGKLVEEPKPKFVVLFK